MEKIDLILNFIYNKIQSEEWKVGDKIFGELQFAKELNISRVTVREGLSILAKKGIIEKKVGNGTFIKDISKIKKKPYIIIIVNEKCISNIVSSTYSYNIEASKRIIEANGFIPLIYVDIKNLEVSKTLEDKINNIGGVLSIKATDETLKYFSDLNIPIVSLISATATAYPTIIFDYKSLMNDIITLIEKYEFKNILAISYNNTIDSKQKAIDLDDYIHFAIQSYFRTNYNLQVIQGIDSIENKVPASLRNIFQNLKEKPDLIVFLDDTIYKGGTFVFNEWHNLIKNVKIITESGTDYEFSKIYDICRIYFNFDYSVKKGFDLLMKLINNDIINEYNIMIKPVIKDEYKLLPKEK